MKSIEELKLELSKLKMGTSFLAGIILVMIVVCILGTVKNGIDFMTFLPVFFIPMLLINYFKIRKLSKEIKANEAQM